MRRQLRSPITRKPQLSALASPARQEILDVLSRTGPATAADLGRLLGRPSDGLYYHLRSLESVGLVAQDGARLHRGRREALYQTVHAEPSLRHLPTPRGNTPAVTAIVAAMLRLGIRDFRRAAAEHSVETRGPRREIWALRATGWLSPGDLEVVNRRIVALRSAVARRSPDARLFGITILLTPLDHRARKSRMRPRRPASRRGGRR